MTNCYCITDDYSTAAQHLLWLTYSALNTYSKMHTRVPAATLAPTLALKILLITG